MRRRRVLATLLLATTAALIVRCATVGQLSHWHEEDVARKLGELEELVQASSEALSDPSGEAVARLLAEHDLEAAVEEDVDDEPFREAEARIDADSDRFVLVSVPGSRDALRLGPSDELVAPVGFFEILAVAPAALAAWLVVRSLSASHRRRLRAIARTALRLERGDWLARVDPDDERPDALGRLAAAINGVGDRLQRVSEGQRELLQAVSHELRTPPSRIRFRLELLQDASSEEEKQRHVSGIDRDVSRLDELVDELLLFVRFDEGGGLGAREPVDLASLLHEIAREAQALAPEKRLEREGPDGVRIHGSPRHVRRALENLVLNACRHASGVVRISWSRLGREPVEVVVEDDGPGIPAEQRVRIFEPFARVDAHRGESSGGVGLGLAIVRRILEAHGGSVEAGASGLGGARFITRWPAEDTNGDKIPTDGTR